MDRNAKIALVATNVVWACVLVKTLHRFGRVVRVARDLADAVDDYKEAFEISTNVATQLLDHVEIESEGIKEVLETLQFRSATFGLGRELRSEDQNSTQENRSL